MTKLAGWAQLIMTALALFAFVQPWFDPLPAGWPHSFGTVFVFGLLMGAGFVNGLLSATTGWNLIHLAEIAMFVGSPKAKE